jgi:hypothetical protein
MSAAPLALLLAANGIARVWPVVVMPINGRWGCNGGSWKVIKGQDARLAGMFQGVVLFRSAALRRKLRRSSPIAAAGSRQITLMDKPRARQGWGEQHAAPQLACFVFRPPPAEDLHCMRSSCPRHLAHLLHIHINYTVHSFHNTASLLLIFPDNALEVISRQPELRKS